MSECAKTIVRKLVELEHQCGQLSEFSPKYSNRILTLLEDIRTELWRDKVLSGAAK